ncbi:unnamed protein product [Rhizophagus irregularis]|nr:unnamed protein product [Rhizophagus irregularis]
MSCSKIFSGDLPELIYGILKYFQNDYSTLHSCILVNRLWCRSAIPLLWENPFSIPIKNYNFIIIYSHNSNSDFKTKLIEYKIINNNSLPPNTLFNYPSFLKYLRINNKFIYSVRNWVGNAIRTSNPGHLSLLSDFERKVDIFVSLFKIFIENEIKLHTFEIEFSRIACVYTYLNNILELILQNTNFIHNIRNINLFVGSNSSGIIPNANKKYKLIKNNLSQIINLQQNLKKILIDNGSFPLYRPLLLSKDSNCSNTLNTITFYKINLDFLILITKYCKNIKFFDFRGPVSLSTYQILNLVENIQQNLNYLTIDVWYDNTGSNSSTILLHLGYYLPSKLEYLCFDLHYIKASWFEEFLRQSQHTFIKKLLINSSEGQDILPFIKEYIMKKKRVKYLAISDSSREDTFDRYSHNVKEICSMKYNEVNNVKELFSLKYEVDEFRLYNIEVQSYLSLKINSYNYIKEIN